MADDSTVTGELTQHKIMDSLSALDDDKSLVIPDDEKITDVEDGSEELVASGDDEELEEVKPELKLDDDELVVSEAPNRKEILAKYPKLFKDFPTLESAIYREHEFSELFPTIADAKGAVTAQQNLAKIESELMSGNVGDTLLRVKNVFPEAFAKIVNPYNLLTTIGKIDKESYLAMISHVMKNALVSVLDSGKKIDTGDDSEGRQLQIASKLVHKFFFNDFNVTAPETNNTTETRVDPKEEAINRREQEANARDLKTASDSIASVVKYRIETFVKDNIDPKDQMSPYVKNNAVRDVVKNLDEEMSNDPRFRTGINRLYEDARKSNYSEDSKAKIRKALLSKAQTILPTAIRKIRSEVLKGNTERSSDRPKYRDTAAPKEKSQNNTQPSKKIDGGSVSGILSALNS